MWCRTVWQANESLTARRVTATYPPPPRRGCFSLPPSLSVVPSSPSSPQAFCWFSLSVISGLANIQNIFTFSFSINLSNLFSFFFTLVFLFSFLYFSSLLLLLPHFPLLSPLFEPWRPPCLSFISLHYFPPPPFPPLVFSSLRPSPFSLFPSFQIRKETILLSYLGNYRPLPFLFCLFDPLPSL